MAVECGQVVAEGFAAGRAGDDGGVFAALDRLPGLGLVGIQCVDALCVEGCGQGRMQGLGQGSILCGTRRQFSPGGYVGQYAWVGAPGRKEISERHCRLPLAG